MPNFMQRLGATLKSWLPSGAAYYSYGSSAPWFLGDTSIDFRSEAGPFDSNSVVMACANWVVTAFPEAPIQVRRPSGSNVDIIPGHEMLSRIDEPNEYYTGLDLWQATLTAYNLDGNAYWIALLNGGGRAVELWWEPNETIRAIGSETELISKWQVYRQGKWIDLDPTAQAVIHFRRGIDPRNQRLGLSRLRAAYRELYTDEEAGRYTATLLRNMGIPGVIIWPENPKEEMSKEQADTLKASYMAKTQGSKRGEPIILRKAVNVLKLNFSPAEMDLGSLRTIPEERISALMGVPAIIAGLGAGLDQATYSNYEQALQHAWSGNIIPTQRVIAMTLSKRLLPLCGGRPNEYVTYDLSQVRALQEDQTALYARMNVAYNGGWLKLNEVRTATGWPALDKAGDTFKAPPALPTVVPAKRLLVNGYSAKALPAARTLERQFETAVQGWVEDILRDALAETPGKALISVNGHSEGR